MAASGSAAARSHSATPSAFACGMASSRTSKRATHRIPTLALGLSTLRLPSLLQYFSMGCEATHNRQSPPSRGCTSKPDPPFRLALILLQLDKTRMSKKDAGDLGTYHCHNSGTRPEGRSLARFPWAFVGKANLNKTAVRWTGSGADFLP